jgi:hypothetical protein
MRLLGWWPATAAVLLVGAIWIWAARAPETAAGGRIASPRAGFPAPDFTLPLASGGTANLADYRGRVVILNLWASWCLPCRAEMPAIEAVYVADVFGTQPPALPYPPEQVDACHPAGPAPSVET